MLLIFDMHDVNGELFLKASRLFLLLALLQPVTHILSLLQQYMHHYSHTNLILAYKFETLYSCWQNTDHERTHLLQSVCCYKL